MKLLCLLLLISLGSHCSEQAFDVLSYLSPKILKKLNLSESFSREKAMKTLGKPTLQERGADYYALEGRKYPLSVKYENGKSKKVYYRYIHKRVPLKALLKELKDRGIGYTSDVSDPGQIHIILKAQGLRLRAPHGSQYLDSFEKEYK